AAHRHHVLALGDEALHALADLGRVRHTELGERILDAFQLAARLREMVLERVSELLVVRSLRQPRERHDEVRLGAVQIRELLLQDVLERMEPHVISPPRVVFGRPGSAPCRTANRGGVVKVPRCPRTRSASGITAPEKRSRSRSPTARFAPLTSASSGSW